MVTQDVKFRGHLARCYPAAANSSFQILISQLLKNGALVVLNLDLRHVFIPLGVHLQTSQNMKVEANYNRGTKTEIRVFQPMVS